MYGKRRADCVPATLYGAFLVPLCQALAGTNTAQCSTHKWSESRVSHTKVTSIGGTLLHYTHTVVGAVS